MSRAQRTTELQRNGGLNCAQAILTVFGKDYGVTPEAAKILGRPWGGGMAQQAKTCGYITGALLVLAYAFKNGSEEQSRSQVKRATCELFRRFEALRGSTLCKDLLGADMSTSDGALKIKDNGLVKKICCSRDGIGRDVAVILEDLIESGS